MIVIDYDDTLFPTSYLGRIYGWDTKLEAPQLSGLSEITLKEFSQLDSLLVVVLELAHTATQGKCFVVSNASTWWLNYSMKTLLPKTFQWMIKQKQLQEKLVPSVVGGIPSIHSNVLEEENCFSNLIISAKDRYRSKFPTEVLRWKAQAFLDLRNYFERDKHTVRLFNITSVGDSEHEEQATFGVSKVFPNALTKIVNFVRNPSLSELLIQLRILIPRLQEIVDRGENLKVEFSRLKSMEPYYNSPLLCSPLSSSSSSISSPLNNTSVRHNPYTHQRSSSADETLQTKKKQNFSSHQEELEQEEIEDTEERSKKSSYLSFFERPTFSWKIVLRFDRSQSSKTNQLDFLVSDPVFEREEILLQNNPQLKYIIQQLIEEWRDQNKVYQLP